MSEFLDRLIARSAGLEEVIRPRTSSLFEPYSLDVTRATPAAFGNAEFEELGGAPDAGQHLLRGSTVQRNHREPTPKQFETAPDHREEITLVAQPSSLRTATSSAPVSSPAAVESRAVASAGNYESFAPDGEGRIAEGDSGRGRPQRLERANVEHAARPTFATQVQGRSTQVAFQESSSHPHAEVVSSATPPSPRRRSIGNAFAAHGGACEVVRESVVNRRAAAGPFHWMSPPPDQDVPSAQPVFVRARAPAEATRLTEQPRVIRPLEQQPRQSELRRPAGQQPAIQVTIGRIDVRAENPPSPPPIKERSNLRPMSLDEYLRRRTGGGRE